MKFTLIALLATTATLAAPTGNGNGNDKVYLANPNVTCYKVLVGESVRLECKSGHWDNATVVSPTRVCL